MNASRRRPLLVTAAVIAGLATTLAGLRLALDTSLGATRRQASVAGLELTVERARWMQHQMHEEGMQMPAAMMPGMPPLGIQRLHLEVTVRNAAAHPQRFRAEDLMLVGDAGARALPDGGGVRELELHPGERLTTNVYFDVPESDRPWRLTWTHRGAALALWTTVTPRHVPPPLRDPWPAMVEALPEGRADEGAKAYVRQGCFSCHGAADVPGSNTLGPDLHAVGRLAGERQPGVSAAQYLYDSLREPDLFIAPRCAAGLPCASPSAMPSYRHVSSPQEAADLVAFLLARQGGRHAIGGSVSAGPAP